ncbi:signal recognition particle 9 kDa protein-domain-containing protein [Rhexocercosporidium sp. MPI-PUGE-AT-0058]|nr:signal recognition particle 9 kDa protein-domain-containing protein [Rhexocercosporidium sp. MPI-PUGE-AT-0058]
MPYLETAQQWLTQSTLLLKARPSTTRITSKYTISPPSSSTTPSTNPPTTTTTTPTARATLTLKTYDPQSGTTLKYTTNKGAEVSRLIQILGRLARGMAGLEERDEGVLGNGEEIKEEDGVAAPAVKTVQGGQQGGQQQQQGGKGKGKKKGKK